MPNILGVELKKIKIANGEDHDMITADIFINDKKAGSLLDDGWCDELYLEFKNNKIEEEFITIMKKYYKRHKITETTSDRFIIELLNMNQMYRSEGNKKKGKSRQLALL